MKSPSVVLSICATALLSQGCATAPPIHIAAANGQLDQVQRAAEKGTDLNLNSGNFGTPLHQAAINGHTGIAEWLLSQGAKIDSRSTAGTTPLYEAVHHEHEQMTQLLLAHNANPNLPNNDGFAPLHLSLSKTNRTHALTKRLLEAGADPNALTPKGWRPLHIAAQCGDLESASLLLDHGAQVDGASDSSVTPLLSAATLGDAAMVDLLVSRGAKLEKKDFNGTTPLIAACGLGHKKACESLLRAGASMDAKDDFGYNPLIVALRNGCFEPAKLLIARGNTLPAETGAVLPDKQCESALYRKLLADQQRAEGCVAKAKQNYAAALQSLTAWRAEFSRNAAANLSTAQSKEFWTLLAQVGAGALLEFASASSSYQRYRYNAQLAALRSSHSQPEYFAKASQIESFSRWAAEHPPSGGSAGWSFTAPSFLWWGAWSLSQTTHPPPLYQIGPTPGRASTDPASLRANAAWLRWRVDICDHFIQEINQALKL